MKRIKNSVSLINLEIILKCPALTGRMHPIRFLFEDFDKEIKFNFLKNFTTYINSMIFREKKNYNFINHSRKMFKKNL